MFMISVFDRQVPLLRLRPRAGVHRRDGVDHPGGELRGRLRGRHRDLPAHAGRAFRDQFWIARIVFSDICLHCMGV